METSDWDNPALRKLSQAAKHLRRYLWDKCDTAGVIHLDFDAFSLYIGEPINEQHLTELGDWVERMNNGRLLIPSFCFFQSGELSEACRAHLPILKLVQSHCLVLSGKDYHENPDSLSGDFCLSPDRHQYTDKYKEQLKEKDPSKEIPPTLETVKAYAKEHGLPEDEAIRFHGFYTSNGWKVGRNPMKSWHGAIATWRGNLHFQNAPSPRINGANTVLLQKEYDRVLDRMRTLKGNYASHQTWDKKDIEEWGKLKPRRDELRKILGVTI